jgi:hypothetical protein
VGARAGGGRSRPEVVGRGHISPHLAGLPAPRQCLRVVGPVLCNHAAALSPGSILFTRRWCGRATSPPCGRWASTPPRVSTSPPACSHTAHPVGVGGWVLWCGVWVGERWAAWVGMWVRVGCASEGG